LNNSQTIFMMKSKKAITGKTLRTILIKEFEQYLKGKYQVEKEVPIKKYGSGRRFRFDYVLNNEIVAEINGAAYLPFGRHTYGKGYETDLMKMNLAQSVGLKYYQFTYDMLKRQEYKLFL
jgi:hypothetical protein